MRYYFNIRNDSGLARDPEGADFDTLEAASDEAVQSAREILAERLVRGEIIDGDIFEITTEAGEVVNIIKFKDTLRFDRV